MWVLLRLMRDLIERQNENFMRARGFIGAVILWLVVKLEVDSVPLISSMLRVV